MLEKHIHVFKNTVTLTTCETIHLYSYRANHLHISIVFKL